MLRNISHMLAIFICITALVAGNEVQAITTIYSSSNFSQENIGSFGTPTGFNKLTLTGLSSTTDLLLGVPSIVDISDVFWDIGPGSTSAGPFAASRSMTINGITETISQNFSMVSLVLIPGRSLADDVILERGNTVSFLSASSVINVSPLELALRGTASLDFFNNLVITPGVGTVQAEFELVNLQPTIENAVPDGFIGDYFLTRLWDLILATIL